jgi:fructokinase
MRMSEGQALYGAIEAGGTKFVCAVGHMPDRIVQEHVIPTTQPLETMTNVVRFFEAMQQRHGALAGIGIASFGPLQLQRGSPEWGRLLQTPKPGWSNASLIEPLRAQWPACPIEIDTDVSAAALAEALLGAAQGMRSLVYITVGTGIGGGVVVNGESLRGWMHPEMGHIHVRRDPRDVAFQGACPFHGDCLEGLASGVAIQRRWGSDLSKLPVGHEAHSIVAYYLGQLAGTIVLMLSAERIVFGGGVMSNGALLPHIRAVMSDMLAGYIPARDPEGAVEEIVVHSHLQGRAGLLGALLLARRAAADAPADQPVNIERINSHSSLHDVCQRPASVSTEVTNSSR